MHFQLRPTDPFQQRYQATRGAGNATLVPIDFDCLRLALTPQAADRGEQCFRVLLLVRRASGHATAPSLHAPSDLAAKERVLVGRFPNRSAHRATAGGPWAAFSQRN